MVSTATLETQLCKCSWTHVASFRTKTALGLQTRRRKGELVYLCICVSNSNSFLASVGGGNSPTSPSTGTGERISSDSDFGLSLLVKKHVAGVARQLSGTQPV